MVNDRPSNRSDINLIKETDNLCIERVIYYNAAQFEMASSLLDAQSNCSHLIKKLHKHTRKSVNNIWTWVSVSDHMIRSQWDTVT